MVLFFILKESGIRWSEPMLVELPFGTRQYYPELTEDDPIPLFSPQLIIDEAGFVHAFWMGEEAELFHSRVLAASIADFEAWEPPRWERRQVVAEGVVSAEVLAGVNGRLHVAYIQTTDIAERAAGLYHLYSDDGGLNWTDPHSLYQSTYFRLLTSSDAHVQMDLDGQNLYVTWDDRASERVFLVRSGNNGIKLA